MDRQAPRSAPPFGSSVKPQIWTDGGSSSAVAVGGLLEEVRPQSAGHLSFVRDATANDSFQTLRAGAIDPEETLAASEAARQVSERSGRSERRLNANSSAKTDFAHNQSLRPV